MLKKNQIIELNINKLVLGGEGFSRYENFAVFVPNALPGDRIQGRVISNKSTYARALVEEVLEPSVWRTPPLCSETDRCGGCQWQALDYPHQLQAKAEILRETLVKTAGVLDADLTPVFLPLIGMESPYYYRNKGQFPVQMIEGQIRGGLYQKHSHQLVPLSSCPIHHLRINQIFQKTLTLCQKYQLQAYNEKLQTGEIRHLVIRHGFATDQSLLGIVTRTSQSLPQAFIQDLQTQNPSLVGILQNINPDPGNRILGKNAQLLWGKDHLEEHLSSLRFQISLPAFFQVNPQQTERLYNTVLKFTQQAQAKIVVDAYAGTGSISLWLAPYVEKVLGMDIVPEAIANAKTNAALNQKNNLDFQVGQAEAMLPKLLSQTAIDLVILDPPRKGCAPEVLESLIRTQIPAIIYVSCHPATLARDLKKLLAQGYRLEAVQGVDMFPHTYHLETVCYLRKIQ